MIAAKPQQKGVNGATQRPHSTYFMQQNYEGQTNGWSIIFIQFSARYQFSIPKRNLSSALTLTYSNTICIDR